MLFYFGKALKILTIVLGEMCVPRSVLIIPECLQACLPPLIRREGLWNYAFAGMLVFGKPIQPLFRTEFERILSYHKFSENRQLGRQEEKTRNAVRRRVRTTAVLWI